MEMKSINPEMRQDQKAKESSDQVLLYNVMEMI